MDIVVHAGDPEKARQELREFYELLGRAISKWAIVEELVFHTFSRIIEPGDDVASAAAYHCVFGMPTRLNMITAALGVSEKHKTHLPAWKKLCTKLRKQSGRRAKLAHWIALHDPARTNDAGVTIYLQPPRYDFGKIRGDGTTEIITAKQLVEWAAAFDRLCSEVDDFWEQLAEPDK